MLPCTCTCTPTHTVHAFEQKDPILFQACSELKPCIAHPVLQVAVVISFLGRSFAVGLVGLRVIPMPVIILMFLKYRAEVILVLTLSAVQRVSGLCMLYVGAAACLAKLTCLNMNACICAPVTVTWCSLAIQSTAEQPFLLYFHLLYPAPAGEPDQADSAAHHHGCCFCFLLHYNWWLLPPLAPSHGHSVSQLLHQHGH